MKFGYIGEPTTLLLGPARPRELGVLLVHEEAEVRGEQAEDDERDDEHVQDEQPRE